MCCGVGDKVRAMFFDAATLEMVRKAVAEGRYDLLYVMVPAMDGGQTYEMKCKIYGEFGNIMASTFSHAEGCPVEIEEKRSSQRAQK
jgi:hypothetical protein